LANRSIIGLERSQIADFDEAFKSALVLADADLGALPSGIPDM
jgi:hypothetical protein